MAAVLPVEVVKQNLKAVLASVKTSSEQVRQQCVPRLVAVGKTFPASLTEACYQSGQRHFGENYVHELETKTEELSTRCPDLKWHFIGRIQSNKIKKLCEIKNLWCVETVENEKHCELFQKYLSAMERRLNVFVQVNTSAEPNKGGVLPSKLTPVITYILQKCPNLDFIGLMTIGSITQSQQEDKNADFECLRKLKIDLCKTLSWEPDRVELSMGMTSDFSVAIRYGSTNVRVGSAIFGNRLYPNEEKK